MSHVLVFDRVDHFVRVPVRIDDRDHRFLLGTDFLDRYCCTFVVSGDRILLAPP
jgi:hypothetical protein